MLPRSLKGSRSPQAASSRQAYIAARISATGMIPMLDIWSSFSSSEHWHALLQSSLARSQHRIGKNIYVCRERQFWRRQQSATWRAREESIWLR